MDATGSPLQGDDVAPRLVLTWHREVLAALADSTTIETLSVLPILIMTLVLPRFPWKGRNTTSAPNRSHCGLKAILAFGLVLCQVIKHSIEINKVYIMDMLTRIGPMLAVTEACLASTAVILRHDHQDQSTVLVGGSLSLSLTVDMVRLYVFALHTAAHDNVVAMATILLKLALIVVIEMSAKSDWPAKEQSGEHGGFWSQTLLLWLGPTIRLGFNRQLKAAHLTSLGPDYASESLAKEFDGIWASCDRRIHFALLRVCVETVRWPFWLSAIPRILMTISRLAIPFLIYEVSVFLDEDNSEAWDAEALILATSVVFFGYTVSAGAYQCLRDRCATQLRSILTYQILVKTPRLKYVDAKEAAVLTHMTTDIEAVLENFISCFDLGSSLFQVVISLCWLWKIISYAALLPIALVTLLSIISSISHNAAAKPSKLWSEAIETRLDETSDILAKLRGIKIMGVEDAMGQRLQGLREKEVHAHLPLQRIRVALELFVSVSYWGKLIAAPMGAYLWTTFQGRLHPVQVMITVAFANLLTTPLLDLVSAYSRFNTLVTHLRYIEGYLLLPERIDRRTIKDFTVGDRHRRKIAYNDESSDEDSDESGHYSSDDYSDSSSDDYSDYSAPSDVEDDEVEETFKQQCFSLRDVTVAAEDSKRLVLDRVHFSILRSTMVMIIGPSASGKSVLLKTLVGEANLQKGVIEMSDQRVSFCGQDPWLTNEPLRTIILGSTPFTSNRYKAVMDACALNDEFKKLERGDATLAGINGANITRKLKKLVVLARALYSPATTLVFDDVLTGLDRQTAIYVFGEVFGSTGLLREQGRTVIYATQCIDWIRHADQVILTRVNGRATSHCIPEALQLIPKLKRSKVRLKILRELPKDHMGIKIHGLQENLELMRSISTIMPGDRSWLRPFSYSPVPGWIMVFVFAIIVFVGLLEGFPSLSVHTWFKQKSVDHTTYALSMIFTMGIVMTINGIVAWLYFVNVAPPLGRGIHKALMNSWMGSSFIFMTEVDTCSLVKRLCGSMTAMGDDAPILAYQSLYALGAALANALVILSVATSTLLWLPFCMFIFNTLVCGYTATSQQMHLLELEAQTPLLVKVHEMAVGLSHLRSAGLEAQAMKRNLVLLDAAQTSSYYAQACRRWLSLVLDLFAAIIAVVIVCVAVSWTEETSHANFGLAMIGVMGYTEIASSLVHKWTALDVCLGKIGHLEKFMAKAKTEPVNPADLVQPAWMTKSEIRFSYVSAFYGLSGNPPHVLSNVTVKIPHGYNLAVVSPKKNGSSSLLLSLLGFLHYHGHLTIGGIDVRRIPYEILRQRVTVLVQDPFELPGTVLDNLLPLRHSVDSKGKPFEMPDPALIEKTLRDVHVWHMIEMCGGLDTPMKEAGLDSEHRQYLNVARAILHHRANNSTILLTDKSEGCRDAEAAATVYHALQVAFRGCTRITVINREREIAGVDIAMTMNDGAVTNISYNTRDARQA